MDNTPSSSYDTNYIDDDNNNNNNHGYGSVGRTVYLSESPNPWFKNKQYKKKTNKNNKNYNLVTILLIVLIIIIAIIFCKN